MSEPVRVCSTCRVVLRRAACPADEHHDVLDLREPDHVRRLDGDIWKHDRRSVRRAMAERDTVLRLLPMTAGLVVPVVLFPFIGAMPWGPTATLAATAAVGGGSYALSHARGYRRLRGRPRGLPAPRVTHDCVTFTGRTWAARHLTSPLAGKECIAYYVQFTRDGAEGGRVILRESRSVDLRIRVDDAEVVRVGEGLWPIVDDDVYLASGADVRRYLASLGLSGDGRRLALTRATERILLPGDVVEVAGTFDDAFEHLDGAMYRGAPTRVHTPRSLQYLRVDDRPGPRFRGFLGD